MAKLVTSRLADLLTDQDPKVRDSALTALSEIGSEAKAAIPALKLVAADGKGQGYPLRAILALVQMGPEGRSVLLDLAKNNVKDDLFSLSLQMSAPTLALLGGKDAVPFLIEMFKGYTEKGDENLEGARFFTLLALEMLGPDAKDAVPMIRQLLKTGSPEEKQVAVMVLGKIGPAAGTAVPELKQLLDDPKMREMASRVLRRIAPEEARKLLPPLGEEIDKLIEKLKAAKGNDQIEAALALGEIGPEAKKAVPALIDVLKKGDEPAIRAARALASIGPAAVPALVATLKDEKDEVRCLAIKTLGRIGGVTNAAAPELLKALKDPTPAVRLAAAQSLGYAEPEARSTVAAALTEALRDTDADVRRSAREALRRIDPKNSPSKNR